MGILLLPSNSPAERGAHIFFPVLDKSYHSGGFAEILLFIVAKFRRQGH